MGLVPFRGARLHVAGEAQFECDAAFVDFLEQRHVFEKPRGVPDAMCVTVVHRLPD